MEEDHNISNKLKEYLRRKLYDLQMKVKKLKRKRKTVKVLYYSSITLSISLTAVMTTLSGFSVLPIYIIPIMSTSSGILTGLSAKFNLHNKNIDINKTIEKTNKIQEKLDYVISCNGNLTEDEFKQIIADLSIL